jgi:hypothetical protein
MSSDSVGRPDLEASPQFVQPIARAATHRRQRRIPGTVLLALGTMSALGVAYVIMPRAPRSAPAAPAEPASVPPAQVAPAAPPASPEPPSTSFDLENGFSYSRLDTLEAFKVKYPDAMCVDDETCVSPQALADAHTSLPCDSGAFLFERGRAVGMSCKFNVTVGAYLILSTTEKYGPVELIEDGQAFSMHSRRNSWFIKGGTFTVTTWDGYDFHGEPATDDITVAFHEGRQMTALPETRLPAASTTGGE